MTWVRHDDTCPEHPKLVGLSDAAFRLLFNAKCYASRQLTDGRIPVAIVAQLLPTARRPQDLVDELLAAGCLEIDGARGGYAIHDFLVYNRSRADVLAERAAAAERQARRRRNGLGQYDPTPDHPPRRESRRDAAVTHAVSNGVGHGRSHGDVTPTPTRPEISDPLTPAERGDPASPREPDPDPEPARGSPRAAGSNPRAKAARAAAERAKGYEPGPLEPPPPPRWTGRSRPLDGEPATAPGDVAELLSTAAESIGRGPAPSTGRTHPAPAHDPDPKAAG